MSVELVFKSSTQQILGILGYQQDGVFTPFTPAQLEQIAAQPADAQEAFAKALCGATE